ncbi:hypothetical protein JM83_2583 [Gillisia sp. Hel_I_86]|uniref:hypothetical protein n=1 Tax=Gillisia sp. Hel_I_86 TaxID=1249981 RepID=UPI00119A4F0C|nr:hypothetical protein [Gillisia sp. Hel_I_86]TVZ27535.1 hypothetical protein JM83_2583 [Gillisia sp. Hel_I_86]
MKDISFTLDQNNFVSHYILNRGLSQETENEDESSSSFAQTFNKNSQKENAGGSNFLSNFWNRLISTPESFSQHSSTSISTILEEEKGISSSNMINTVLSQKLNLEPNSTALSEAAQECNKIYHEDFPGDYILEFRGDRLGIFLRDLCYDANGKAMVEYIFKPEIKSFRGLF